MKIGINDEKAGTGMLDMIALCREANLPEPDFEQRAGQWVVTLWRDWLTAGVIASFDLNELQLKAISAFRQERRVTNTQYQEITGASRATAKRDLEDLVRKGVLVPTEQDVVPFITCPRNGSSESHK
jgi:ATP-dependent DNA helicase RecG